MDFHHCLFTECGEMYTWGENEHRQLGTSGIKQNKVTPTLVETLAGKHVLAIALGIFHSEVLVC